MERVVTRIEYPGAAPVGLPDIHLDFAYAGTAAVPLFYGCCKFDDESGDLPVRLWRFRVTGQDGATTECCFRAVVHKMADRRKKRHPGMFYGTFTVLDAQPFIEEV